MCQVLMKLFGKPMDTLDPIFIPIEHPDSVQVHC